MSTDPFKLLGRLMVGLSREMNKGYRQRRELYLEGIEPTLVRLDEAIANLESAVEAVDVLKRDARIAAAHTKDLQDNREIKLAAYREALQLLDDTNALLQRDKKRLQQALGISPWRERLWGFGFGIAASLVATFLWEWLKR